MGRYGGMKSSADGTAFFDDTVQINKRNPFLNYSSFLLGSC